MAVVAGDADVGLTGIMGDSGVALVAPGVAVPPPTLWTAPVPYEVGGPDAAGVVYRPETVLAKKVGGTAARSPLDDWFDRTIVLPNRIEAGLVLNVKVFPIDLFNAYRYERRTLTGFVNDAGSGVVIPDLPSLPADFGPIHGIRVSLNVLPDGPPRIDGDLLFEFDDRTSRVHLTGERAILLAVEPVTPIVENLSFRTDVLRHVDGTEQRVSQRLTPRQTFDLVYELEGFDRQYLESRLFAASHRPFGLPLWHQPTNSTAAISPGDTSVSVESTAYADFRVGSLALVWRSAQDHEALVVASFDATTLSFTSAFTRSFSRGARVLPVRTVLLAPRVAGEKYRVTLQRTRVRATVVDGGEDVSSAAGYATYQGRPVVTDAVVVDATQAEGFDRVITYVDGETGTARAFADEPVARRSAARLWTTRTRARVWELRRLFHFLRGRQGSFWAPTFFDDLTPKGNFTSLSTSLTIVAAGFAKFVKEQKPRGIVRVTRTNGATLIRAVVSATEVDETTDSIVVDSAWGFAGTPADVTRVEYLERSRLDVDDVVFRHADGVGSTRVEATTRAVLE